jgi:8-oxo-dGTP diphosphatase
VIEAAGGVVWRDGDTRGPEVVLVHRPKYHDWSLPKGKLTAGEDHETAARREVEEETGLHVTLGPELPSTSYHDRYGRPKVVRYWSMHADGGKFTPNDEVDEIRWLPIEDAVALVSYERDQDVLYAFGEAQGLQTLQGR